MFGIENIFRKGRNRKLLTLRSEESGKPVDLLRLNSSGPILKGKEANIIEGMVKSFNCGVGLEIDLPAASVRRAIVGGFFAERGLVKAFENPNPQISGGSIKAEMANNLYMFGMRFTALRILAGTTTETPRDLYVLHDYHPPRLSVLGNNLRRSLRFG